MAKLPPTKRIITEEFPQQKDWIGKLLQPVNEFFQSVATALNKNLTFEENVDCMVKELEVAGFPTRFKWTRNRRPVGLWIVNCEPDPGAAITPVWEITQDNQISITDIHGITPTDSNKYDVTVIVITG